MTAPSSTDRSVLHRLRARWDARQADEAAAEAAAQAELDRDERRGDRTAAPTLAQAFGTFWRHPSPWIMSAALVLGLAARLLLGGGWHAADAWVPLALVASFPFVEWVVHVVVLHHKPVEVRGRLLDTRLARDHRAHHADPRDLPLVFIPTPTYLWLVPVLLGVALLGFDRLGLGLTWFAGVAAIGVVYEWTHYLIHSDYRPASRPYRAIWRNHRLHHYKNEHYWFTVTTAGTSDRLLGTAPDPSTVATSPTAKDLHGLTS